jgi:putative flavoprotein involved in K+ transport
MREHHDTVIVGAGQAGLAMSAVLRQRGREHVVLERRRVGERWRTERWDSLRFQFPNSGDRLAIEANANQLLDEADKAYADFLLAAREFALTRVQEERTEEQPAEPARLPAAINKVDSLNLARENINTIIWATGYGYDFDWVKVPVFDERGRPAQQRGVTQRPGLYFLGLHWMHTFKSGLFSGAEYLAEHMARTR